MGRSRKAAWAELHTGVVIGASEATALALGGSELEVVPLAPGATAIEYFGHQGASDAWASTSGAIYLCLSRPDPLIARIGDDWAKVPLLAKVRYYLHRVVGFSGATPADDELYCLGSRYDDDDDEMHGLLLWRNAGAWREVALPPGKLWELAVGKDREVYVSVGLDRAAIVRVREGVATKLKLPAALAAQRAVGLCVAPDGAVVACFAPPKKDRSTVWVRRGDAWKQAGSQGALKGWATGYVDSVAWNGQTYLASDGNVFVLDAAGKLRRDHAFVATRLWPIGDALVCVGYRNGTYAHAILRGAKWEPLMIPDPDIVFGGRGKWVWLPSPRRKVPHKRIRVVSAPQKPAKPSRAVKLPALADYTAHWMKARVFAGARARPEPVALVDAVRDRLATRPSDALRRFLALHGAQRPKSFGQVTVWNDELPEAAASVEHAPAAIATFTNTYWLGTDRGGQCYFVDVAPTSSAVWLYGPGVGVMPFLADSLDALLYLCDLDEQWEAYAQIHDLDFEDIERGDVDAKAPEVRAITAGMKTLEGHVDLSEDTEVTSDFHEVLPGLTGHRPTAKSSSVTARLFDRARWLVMLFGNVYCDITQAVTYDLDRDRADRATGNLAATKVYWLWHLYLFDDPRLAAFAASVARDKASLVRDTAALVLALAKPKPPKALAALVARRDQVRAALKDRDRPARRSRP